MMANDDFQEYVKKLVTKHRDERIYPFQYEGKKYWLKQPEKLKGIWLLLKPRPKQSFKNELQTLLKLAEQNAPVPKVSYYSDHFFVLENVGLTVSQWLCNKNIDEQQKFLIIYDTCLALIDLHAKNLVHGRPAIRDITWDKGKVTFLDFESRSNSRNQNWVVIRDMLFFFDSLCREEDISDTFIQKVALYYQTHCEAKNWQNMIVFLQRFSWVYYLLLPFKPIAKTDLISIYRLFEIFLIKKK